MHMFFAAALLASAAAQQPSARDALRAELAAEVEAYQAQLPVRDGPSTITAVRLEGLQLIYIMQVSQSLDEAGFRRVLEANLCGDAGLAAIVRRGASFSYHVTEPGGRTIVATIDRCPS